LKTIGKFLSHYSALIWAVLKPLGAYGVFLVALVDSAALGMPVDVAVATYVYQAPTRLFLYVLMACAGETLGSLVIYAIGYKGGEELLRKRIPAERFEKIHNAFDKHPFWSLMVPAILPPPTPFKLFALAAAVTEMQLSHYLMAIFAGRFIRFTLLGLLTIKFGPDVLRIVTLAVRRHLALVGLIAAVGLLAWFVKQRAAARAKSTVLG